MKALMGVITVLSVPLIILNMLGGIVSGIWLAILGEWGVIGFGILSIFVPMWILVLPSVLLDAPAYYCAERGKTLGLVGFATLSNLYILALITVWCCGILFLFVKDATASTLIPRLFWSYGAATGPWAYMASREDETSAAHLVTFFAELAYLVIILLVIFTSITLFGAVKVFGGFMLAVLVLQTTLSVMMWNEQKRFAAQSAYSDELGRIETENFENIDAELIENEESEDEEAGWEDEEDEEEDWENEEEQNE